ncbi:MAG TPA: YciI family protein [Rhodothermia bacterium]
MRIDSNDELGGVLSDFPDGERDEIRRTWLLAFAAKDDDVSDGELASAFGAVRRRMGTVGSAPRPMLARIAGMAAVLIGGLLAGYLIPRPPNSDHGHAIAAGEARYLLLIRNDTPPLDLEQREAVVSEYRDWARQLAEGGYLVDAAELRDGGTILIPQANGVEREALSMNEQRASGYFLIQASSRAEAEAIARGCPHLRHGGTVELREIRSS